jgi:hypothetical protein
MNEMSYESTAEYFASFSNACNALIAGTNTPLDNLIWLQALSETWVKQSLADVAEKQQS